jgi:hypothetical protein
MTSKNKFIILKNDKLIPSSLINDVAMYCYPSLNIDVLINVDKTPNFILNKLK